MKPQEFENLDPEKQAEIFYHCSFKEKGELLPYSHSPGHLTRSLSPEELYLVTRELDIEERVEVIRYANLPQLLFISDIDCWKKDRLNGEGFIRWLELLLRADDERLMAWLEEMDYETIIAGFQKIVEVIKPEWEYAADEILGDRPYFTLDNMYYIMVREEDFETVKAVVERLFERHRGRYVALLEDIMNDLGDETEEEAYRKREMRLAERGFPAPDEARHIYKPISQEEFDKFPLKRDYKVAAFENSSVPDYPVLWSEERLFLDEVLILFQGDSVELRESLKEELMWLSNKVIASEGVDFASEERVRHGVERARRFVNIGIESLSGGDREAAKKILAERWFENVFRRGVSELWELRRIAHEMVEVYWKGGTRAFLGFLNPPFDSILKGVFTTVPECYDENVKDDQDFLRDFKTLGEVRAAKHILEEVRLIHAALMKHFPAVFHRLNLEAKREHESQMYAILGTVFAWFVATGGFKDSAIPENHFRAFLRSAFAGGAGKILSDDTAAKFVKAFTGREEVTPFWNSFFERVEQEFRELDPDGQIDPRYVSMVKLTGGKKTQVKKGLLHDDKVTKRKDSSTKRPTGA